MSGIDFRGNVFEQIVNTYTSQIFKRLSPPDRAANPFLGFPSELVVDIVNWIFEGAFERIDFFLKHGRIVEMPKYNVHVVDKPIPAIQMSEHCYRNDIIDGVVVEVSNEIK